MIHIEKGLIGISAFCLAVIALYGLLMAMTEHMPDPPPAESCSCAGRADCRTQIFQVAEGRKAFCAMYEGDQSCCLVVSR